MAPRTKPAAAPATCVAPLDDGELHAHSRLCGERATETRIVEGVALALCAAHAAELDTERTQD